MRTRQNLTPTRSGLYRVDFTELSKGNVSTDFLGGISYIDVGKVQVFMIFDDSRVCRAFFCQKCAKIPN